MRLQDTYQTAKNCKGLLTSCETGRYTVEMRWNRPKFAQTAMANFSHAVAVFGQSSDFRAGGRGADAGPGPGVSTT